MCIRDSLQSNPYANVLYDSIWALAWALNRSFSKLSPEDYNETVIEESLAQVSFQGATGFVNFSQSPAAVQVSVGIFQVKKGETVQMGSYDSSLNQLYLNVSALGKIPSDKIDRLYSLYPTYLTVILCIFLIFSLIFTTITMSLFIHYRKTPEIKATSSVLSLYMFVGCYCLIISSLFRTITSSVVIEPTALRYADCWGNTFLFTVGIDIVFATVFAKTLRIYHIFNKFGKISFMWSDKWISVLILVIVSMKVMLMVVWGLVDIHHLVDEIKPSPQGFAPHYIVVQKCYSRHHSWWTALIFGYTTMLLLPMVHVAILTRKIKREEFKDSKKICCLLYTSDAADE